MNTAEYIGRLVTEPMLNRKVNMEEEHYWSRIRIAVPRKFKKDREKETDFFNCLFFDQAAKYLCQYAKKGGRIYVRGGENRENNYEKDGVKYYTVDLMVKEFEIIDFKEKETKTEAPENAPFPPGAEMR